MRLSRAVVTALVAVSLFVGLWAVPGGDVEARLGDLMAEQVFAGGNESSPCPGAAATRHYDVVAMQVPVVYNHWGDFDPFGRIFVLAADEAAIRADVAAKLAAAGHGTAARVLADPTNAPGELGYRFPTQVNNAPDLDPIAVSVLVRPLVVRANLGECVTFALTNRLPEPVSLHVHNAPARAGDGMVLGRNDPAITLPGLTSSHTVYLPPLPGMEGAHFLHSHADARYQAKHGLFGALVAEPADATWQGADGTPDASGPEAMILRPDAADFREFVIIMHDEIELVDHALRPLPIISPYGEYGPGTKGINLRAEPFMDRFRLHDALGPRGTGVLDRGHDKSLAYSSYTYGDPALFMPQSYVGEPTKLRLVNAIDQHHVFHLHGGGVRWRASPVSDDTQFDDGLIKDNPVVRAKSQRIDVQNIGPGESFNAEIEGGAGGTQDSVGDFLFHCHIVEHYLAGMWGIWRVHNTLQPGLAELPDRLGLVRAGVPSTGLIGLTLPNGTTITAANMMEWVRGQLPPPGVPGPNDAQVWDWTVMQTANGPLVLGEPETTHVWPNYASVTPGERPVVLFDPVTKRPAYPMLTPHLGKRPPFAPGHGPAPYLSPDADPNHPDGLAPLGARLLQYNVTALGVPVHYNANDIDAEGEVFALAVDVPALRNGTRDAENLVIRANVGDKVDVLLTSALPEDPIEPRKVNMHIHLVQFDVQASDGVITGFNYEQSVRSAESTGTALAERAVVGNTTLTVADPTALREGTLIGIGLTLDSIEIRTVIGISGNNVTIDTPLAGDHAPGERVGPEFVRYRWYADVELGTVYWHDHVDGLRSWRHGLFGALIVEPRDSAWRDPTTGDPLRQGARADIVGPNGTWRELVLEFQDRSATLDDDARDLASFNLRSAPFDTRQGSSGPLSSTGNGNPPTPTLEAYPGDPVMLRLLYGANAESKGVGTFGVTGHRFPIEPYNPGARRVDALSFGISSQHDLLLECGAGGCAHRPGDYLYHMTQPELFSRGAWGIIRVHDAPEADLLPLPGHGHGQAGTIPIGPLRQYDVVAMRHDVVYNERANITASTDLFALASDEAAIRNGTSRPQPLVLRALPGETITVTLHNTLDRPVSVAPSLLLADPTTDRGVSVGENPDQSVAPGATRTFTWYADGPVGVAYLTSFAAPATDALNGLYGAVVVEPAGSLFDNATGTSATLTLANGTTAREHVLFYRSDDPAFEASVMPYTVDVRGISAVNYRSEPLAERAGGRIGPVTSTGDPVGGLGIHTCQLNNDTCSSGALKDVRFEVRNPLNPFLMSEPIYGPAETPLLDADSGQTVIIRAVGAAGDQLTVHSTTAGSWARHPDMEGSGLTDAVTLGTREVANTWFVAGLPGDYLYGNHRNAFHEAGQWGILRVS